MPRGRLGDTSTKKLRVNKNPNYMDKADVLGKLTKQPVNYRKASEAKNMALQSKTVRDIKDRLSNRRSSRKVATKKKLPKELGEKIASYL